MIRESDKPNSPQHPWLEYFPEGGDRVQRALLDKDSLTIGRSEAADVQIDSAKVSREHARVICQGPQFVIRDLGSTNGTFVNGQQIEQAELTDGDVILVADTEFAFLRESTSRLRRMATQRMSTPTPLPRVGDTHPVKREIWDSVRELRNAHEQLLQGFTPVDLIPVIQLPETKLYARLARPHNRSGSAGGESSTLLHPPNHALIRLQEHFRREAIDRCASSSESVRLIVPLESWEISENKSLMWHFEALVAALPDSAVLLVHVKTSAAVDLPEVHSFCKDLQEIGVGIACDDFLGSQAQVNSLKELGPELLFLAAGLTNDLHRNAQRKKRLAAIVQACDETGIRPVISRVEDETAGAICLSQGIQLFLQQKAPSKLSALDTGFRKELLAPSLSH